MSYLRAHLMRLPSLYGGEVSMCYPLYASSSAAACWVQRKKINKKDQHKGGGLTDPGYC
ncbi:hypothetical protein DPMN_112635 [Dreissena polymorpha]|uniref:Uncharacterized protein n=1 Tax=Dreissena polymorpha TaxID=45954 RepID=A0A9D4KG08_DREPO|nr:hypothetical protein DPMN_112635 [Dreissena polymorpha]